jgi:hypothetical protein
MRHGLPTLLVNLLLWCNKELRRGGHMKVASEDNNKGGKQEKASKGI